MPCFNCGHEPVLSSGLCLSCQNACKVKYTIGVPAPELNLPDHSTCAEYCFDKSMKSSDQPAVFFSRFNSKGHSYTHSSYLINNKSVEIRNKIEFRKSLIKADKLIYAFKELYPWQKEIINKFKSLQNESESKSKL